MCALFLTLINQRHIMFFIKPKILTSLAAKASSKLCEFDFLKHIQISFYQHNF